MQSKTAPFHAARGSASFRDAAPALSLMVQLFLFEKVKKFFLGLATVNQRVASLLGKGGKIPHRTGIGRRHFENLPAFQFSQCFFGAQNWLRAVESARVDFLGELHGVAQ